MHRARLRLAAIAALANLLAVSQNARAEDSAKITKVAVMKFRAPGFDPGVVDNLYSLFVAEVSNIPGYQAVSNDEIEAMLGFEQQKAMLGCDDTSCLAEIAGALGVDKVISGKVGKVGSTFVINLVLIDNKTSRVVKRITKTVKGEDDVLIETIAQSAHMLLESAQAKKSPLVKATPQTPATPTPPAFVNAGDKTTPAKDADLSSTSAEVEGGQGSFPLLAVSTLAVGGLAVVGGGLALGLSLATKGAYDNATDAATAAQAKGQTQGLWAGSAISGGIGVAALAAGAILLAVSE